MFNENRVYFTLLSVFLLLYLRIARQCLDKVLKRKDKKHSVPGNSGKEAQAALVILVGFVSPLLRLCMYFKIEL